MEIPGRSALEAFAGRYILEYWICNTKPMELAEKDAIYMHCLPADRGVEVSDAVMALIK